MTEINDLHRLAARIDGDIEDLSAEERALADAVQAKRGGVTAGAVSDMDAMVGNRDGRGGIWVRGEAVSISDMTSRIAGTIAPRAASGAPTPGDTIRSVMQGSELNRGTPHEYVQWLTRGEYPGENFFSSVAGATEYTAEQLRGMGRDQLAGVVESMPASIQDFWTTVQRDGLEFTGSDVDAKLGPQTGGELNRRAAAQGMEPWQFAQRVAGGAPAEPAQPVAEPAQPVAEPAQPVAEPAQPVAEPAQPVAEPAQPVAEPSAAEPIVGENAEHTALLEQIARMDEGLAALDVRATDLHARLSHILEAHQQADAAARGEEVEPLSPEVRALLLSPGALERTQKDFAPYLSQIREGIENFRGSVDDAREVAATDTDALVDFTQRFSGINFDEVQASFDTIDGVLPEIQAPEPQLPEDFDSLDATTQLQRVLGVPDTDIASMLPAALERALDQEAQFSTEARTAYLNGLSALGQEDQLAHLTSEATLAALDSISSDVRARMPEDVSGLSANAQANAFILATHLRAAGEEIDVSAYTVSGVDPLVAFWNHPTASARLELSELTDLTVASLAASIDPAQVTERSFNYMPLDEAAFLTHVRGTLNGLRDLDPRPSLDVRQPMLDAATLIASEAWLGHELTAAEDRAAQEFAMGIAGRALAIAIDEVERDEGNAGREQVEMHIREMLRTLQPYTATEETRQLLEPFAANLYLGSETIRDLERGDRGRFHNWYFGSGPWVWEALAPHRIDDENMKSVAEVLEPMIFGDLSEFTGNGS